MKKSLQKAKDKVNSIYGCPNLEPETWYLYVRYWNRLDVYECRTADIYHAVGMLYCRSIDKIECIDYTKNHPYVNTRPFPYKLSI